MQEKYYFKLARLTLALSLGLASLSHAANNSAFGVSSYVVENHAQMSDQQMNEVQQMLMGHVGPGKTVEDLMGVRDQLQYRLDERDPGRYRVVIPDQQVKDGGQVMIHIQDMARVQDTNMQRVLKEVQVEPSRYYSAESIRRRLPSLQEGQVVDLEQLRRDTTHAEAVMGKKTYVVLEAVGDNEVIAKIRAEDRSPFRGYVNIDNYGPRYAKARLGLGFAHANLAGLNDILSLNAIVSEHPNRLYGVALGYDLPFYGRNSLHFNVSHSDVKPNEVSVFEDMRGRSTRAGIHWKYKFPSASRLGYVALRAGYQWREYKDESHFGGFFHQHRRIRTAPIFVGLEGVSRFVPNAMMFFDVDVEHNFAGKLGSSGDDFFYSLRTHARPDFTIAHYRAGLRYAFPGDWQVGASLQGQATDDALISFEQGYLGGPYAVRGYRDSGVGIDSNLIGSLEFSTPAWSFGKGERPFGVRAYVFGDYGRGWRNHRAIFEDRHYTLKSAGIGLKTALFDHFDVNLYYAKQLSYDKKDGVWGSIGYRF